MSKFRRTIGKKAAKAAVRHSAHGVSAKVQRRPLRSIRLLGIGATVGALAGWAAGAGRGAV